MNALSMQFARLFVLAFSVFATVQLASACSVCAVGKEEARGAYYATTAIMSLLPLCLIGGVVYYIAKRSK